MAEENFQFPVDGKLMQILPLAGATFNHPDAPERPELEQIDGNWNLVFRVRRQEGLLTREVARYLPLDDFSEGDLQVLQQFYSNLDFRQVIDVGLRKGLSQIENPKVRSSFLSMLTTLNPRHVAILMYLYRTSHEQNNGPLVRFETNDLLNELYERSNSRGIHDSNKRGTLRRDLWALHRTEIHYSDPQQSADSNRVRILVRTPITINAYEIDRERLSFSDGNFDWGTQDTDRTPDSFVVQLNFYRSGGSVLFPKTLSLKQPRDLQTSRDSRSKLLYFLLSRLSEVREGEYIFASLDELAGAMELNDSNPRRKKATVRKMILRLATEGWLKETLEVLSGRKFVGYKCLFNPQWAAIQLDDPSTRN